MARTKAQKSNAAREEKTPLSSPKKLMLLFTIVNKSKTEFFVDLLNNFEVNFQTVLSAQGTANDQIMSLLGLTDSDRSVILSVIRREKVADAMATLDSKFRTVKGGKGIAYTVCNFRSLVNWK